VSAATQLWQPVQATERYSSLDLLRGFALFGVLVINLLCFFRISLWDHILRFHSDPGRANHAVDLFARGAIEFKAFECFAFTFGIGMAIQAERAKSRGVSPELFLLRRFLVLLAFGTIHMVLISNVDILMLYAVCGLVLTLLLRLPAVVLMLAGIAAIYLPTLLPLGPALPPEADLRNWAVAATEHYSHGSFVDILAFRWRETRALIAPLLFATAQTTAGLMLLGMAAWRAGVIRTPRRFRNYLWIFCALAGVIGVVNTAVEVAPHVTTRVLPVPHFFHMLGSDVPLALACAACLLALWGEAKATGWMTRFAAAGQMALTNYLTQSVVFALIFYGYGLGLFGRLAPAPVALCGVAFYALQLLFSRWWLSKHRFGPLEWIWRSATYGRLQPMRRSARLAIESR
jgi:uncharacterized protein